MKNFSIDYSFINKTQYNSCKNNNEFLIKKNFSAQKINFDFLDSQDSQEQDSPILDKFNHSGQNMNFCRPNLENNNNIGQIKEQNLFVNNVFFEENQKKIEKKSIYLENENIYHLVFVGPKFKIEESDIIIYQCKEYYSKNKGNINNQLIKNITIAFKKSFSKEYLLIISNKDSNELYFGLSSVDDDSMIIFYYENKIFIVIHY